MGEGAGVQQQLTGAKATAAAAAAPQRQGQRQDFLSGGLSNSVGISAICHKNVFEGSCKPPLSGLVLLFTMTSSSIWQPRPRYPVLSIMVVYVYCVKTPLKTPQSYVPPILV